MIEESGVEFEGDEPDLDYAHRVSLGEVDMDEFRQFLDTVSPDEFATGAGRSPPAREAARRRRARRFVSASSSPTSRSRPSGESGPSFGGGERLRAGAARGRDRAGRRP